MGISEYYLVKDGVRLEIEIFKIMLSWKI